MTINDTIPCPRLASRRSDAKVCQTTALSDGWLIAFRDSRQIAILDHGLRVRRRVDAGAGQNGYVTSAVALDESSGQIAVAGRESLRVLDRNGEELSWVVHDAWDTFCGSDVVLGQGSILWHA